MIFEAEKNADVTNDETLMALSQISCFWSQKNNLWQRIQRNPLILMKLFRMT